MDADVEVGSVQGTGGGSDGDGAAKSHPNLAKWAFSKLEHAILAGADFETGATERAPKGAFLSAAYPTTRAY